MEFRGWLYTGRLDASVVVEGKDYTMENLIGSALIRTEQWLRGDSADARTAYEARFDNGHFRLSTTREAVYDFFADAVGLVAPRQTRRKERDDHVMREYMDSLWADIRAATPEQRAWLSEQISGRTAPSDTLWIPSSGNGGVVRSQEIFSKFEPSAQGLYTDETALRTA